MTPQAEQYTCGRLRGNLTTTVIRRIKPFLYIDVTDHWREWVMSGDADRRLTGSVPPVLSREVPKGISWFKPRSAHLSGHYSFTPISPACDRLHYRGRARRGSQRLGKSCRLERTYDYLAAVHGDFKSRFYYTLGGSLETLRKLRKPNLAPRRFQLRAEGRARAFFGGHGCCINYGDAVREPCADRRVLFSV